LLHRAADHEPPPPGGHLQDGTSFGPGRRGRSKAEGTWRQRAPGGGRVHHAAHTGRSHQLDDIYDWRESGRHDQGKLDQMIEPVALRCGYHI